MVWSTSSRRLKAMARRKNERFVQTVKPPYGRTGWPVLAVCLLAAAALAGCGSSHEATGAVDSACAGLTGSDYAACVGGATARSSAEAREEMPAEEAPETKAEAPPEEPVGSLSNVGTITESDGEGTTFSDRYRVGPILYSKNGTPPEEVLDVCNLDNSTEIETSVFARGQVTITYQEGTLPTEVSLASAGARVVQEVNNGELGSGQLDSLVAFRAGGEWWCTSTSFSLEFRSGESQTLPIWVIIPRVLSNAQPRLSVSTLDTWYFEVIGPTLVTGRTVTTHGPGTASCEGAYGTEEQLLFLYNRSGRCV